MDGTRLDQPAPLLNAERKQDQQQGRRQGKAQPGRQGARPARTPQTQRKADLAARRSWQKLAQRDLIGIAAVIDPPSPFEEFLAK